MRKYLFCMVLGYLVGSINPAAWISKRKKINLRKQGTGNLGATNTMLVLGKGYGVLVMLFDIAKAYFTVFFVEHWYPGLALIGLLTGCSTIIGHIFPFYMKFQGGKGVAAFGGTVLAIDPQLFLILLGIGLACLWICNYSVALPISAAILFPFLEGIRSGSFVVFGICLLLGLLIFWKHIPNLEKIRSGKEIQVRDFIQNKLFSKKGRS